MATQFGVDATNLQGPQGAGSGPLEAVREAPWTDANAPLIKAAGDILGEAVKYAADTKKQPVWMAARNQYQKELSTYQQQFLTAGDSTSRNQVLTNIRRLTTKTLADGAGFGEEFAKSISNTYSYARTGTGIDELEDSRKSAVTRTEEAIASTIKSGVFGNNGADLTEEQRAMAVTLVSKQNALEIASKKAIEVEDRTMKRQTHTQGQKTFEQTQEQYFAKQEAQEAMGGLMASGFDLVSQNVLKFSGEVKADGSNSNEILQKFQLTLEPLRTSAGAMLQFNPASLSEFNSSMDRITKLGVDLMDPKKKTEAMADEFSKLITTEKLRIARLKNGTTYIALNQLTNGLAGNMAVGSSVVADAYKQMDEMTSTGMLPAITNGDVATQKPILATLTTGIVKASKGEGNNPKAAFEDGVKSYEAVLNSIRALPPGKVVPLTSAVEFIASPAAKAIIDAGRYNEQVSMGMTDTFKNTYMQGIGRNATALLQAPVGEATYTNGVRAVPSVENLVRMDMGADGNMKVTESRDPRMRITASNVYIAIRVREIGPLANDLSTTVRAIAHLTNRTDYQNVWKEERSRLMPGHFPTPDKIDEAMADGWDGVGSMRNGSSWKRKDAVAK